MFNTTPLSLFIINQVMLRRLISGLSARKLSLILEHGETYVSKIEDAQQVNTYPPHEWPKLAEVLKCEVHDLLPDEESTSTGELVEKKVINLTIEDDARKVIAALKDHGFFDEEKTHDHVLKHLNVQDEEQQKTMINVLNSLKL